MAHDSHKQGERSASHPSTPASRENGGATPCDGDAGSVTDGSRRDLLRWGAATGLLSLLGASGTTTAVAEEDSSTGEDVLALVELNYYVDEDEARVVFDVPSEMVSEHPSARARAVLDRPNGADVVAEGPLTTNGVTVLGLPLDRIEAGEYPVTLSVEDGGTTLWEGADAVVKRPVPPEGTHVTQIDHYRRTLLVDGEPFFPIGIFGVYPDSMQEVADAGFNVTMRWKGATINGPESEHRFDHTAPWNSEHNQETVLPYLDAADEAGLHVVETPPKLAWENEAPENLYIHYNDLNFDEKWPTHAYEIAPGVVENVKNHPATIGYYSFDEPDNFYPTQPDHPEHLLMEEGVEEWYRVVHGLDPYHPVHTLFAVGLSKNVDWNLDDDSDAWDVPMRDFYINTDTHLSEVYDVVTESAKVAEDLREPFVFTPMLEEYSGREKAIAPPEQRAQTYLSLVAGIEGLFYWDFPARYAPNWEMLKRLATEVQELAPILLERSPEQEVRYARSGTSDSVKVLLKNHKSGSYPDSSHPNGANGRIEKVQDGTAFLIAVNAEPAPVEVEFELPRNAGGKADVWFEDRRIRVHQGTFTDTLEPYGRRVYELTGPAWEDGAEVTLDVEVGEPVEEPPDPQFEPTEANLIRNGSFEYDYGDLPGFPAEWSHEYSIMSSGEIGVDDGRWTPVESDAVDGDRCLRMTKTAPGRGDLHDMFNLLTTPQAFQEVEYLEDGTHTLSLWMKADEGPSRTWIWIGWSYYELDVSTEWERYEITHDASAGGGFIRLMMMDQGTLWLDGVQLEKGSTATDYEDLVPTNEEEL